MDKLTTGGSSPSINISNNNMSSNGSSASGSNTHINKISNDNGHSHNKHMASHSNNTKTKKHNKREPPAKKNTPQAKNHRNKNKPTRYGNENQDNASDPYDFEQNLQDQILSSQFRSGTKKSQISINHLLNLQFDHSEANNQNSNNRYQTKNNKYNNHNRYNNEDGFSHLHGASFINATYKFIVQDKYQYQEQYANPNVVLPPERIIRVVMLKNNQQEFQNCPICLSSDIVAPRMVLCGHVFCQTCLLQFFEADNALDTVVPSAPSTSSISSISSSSTRTGQMHKILKKKVHECPLCASIIREGSNNVLPVLFNEISADTNSSTSSSQKFVDFQLMCRPRDSILGLPVSLGLDPSTCEFPPRVSSLISSDNYQFSRIVQTDVLQQIQYYKDDLKNIQEQYQLDKLLYNDDGKFVALAEKLINETIEKLLEEQLHDLDISKTSTQMGNSANVYIGTEGILSKYNDENAFFYYEHVDKEGKRFFLSALDVKILKKAFGSYSEFPVDFHLKIENVLLDQRVSENSIHAFKYFGHLPMGDVFNLVDVDWKYSNVKKHLKPDADIEYLIPSNIMEQYNVQLKSRKSKLSRKKLKEDHEKKAYERQLEIDHYKFYEQEGPGSGSWSSYPQINHHGAQLTEPAELFPQFPPEIHTNNDTSDSSAQAKKEFTKTVWGTVIPVGEQDDSNEAESWLPQNVLDQLDNFNSQNKNSKKSKKKLTLFVNSQRGTL